MTDNLISLHEDKDKGVKGWLSLFVFTLIFVRPVSALLGFAAFSKRYDDYFYDIPILQTIANVTLLVNLLVAAVGIYAGYCLVKLRPNAVLITKAFLIGSAIIIIILNLVVSGYLPDREKLGGELFSNVAGAIGYSVIWYIYLSNSKRVKSTFPNRKTQETENS